LPNSNKKNLSSLSQYVWRVDLSFESFCHKTLNEGSFMVLRRFRRKMNLNEFVLEYVAMPEAGIEEFLPLNFCS
jgi:hypothetical protein